MNFDQTSEIPLKSIQKILYIFDCYYIINEGISININRLLGNKLTFLFVGASTGPKNNGEFTFGEIFEYEISGAFLIDIDLRPDFGILTSLFRDFVFFELSWNAIPGVLCIDPAPVVISMLWSKLSHQKIVDTLLSGLHEWEWIMLLNKFCVSIWVTWLIMLKKFCFSRLYMGDLTYNVG